MARLVAKEVDGVRLLGFSLAGEETVVIAPEFGVSFDVGRAPREVVAVDNICLTHGHMDHAAGIVYYFSQRAFIGNAPGRLIVHRCLAQSIQKLMDIWSEIEGHHCPGNVLGVESLEDVPIRRGLLVRPFAVNHARGSLGYSLIETRHKLKEEFVGKSGPQLVALKAKGVEIQRYTEVSVLTYTGDTAIASFLDHEFVQQSKVVIVECTFFERDHLVRARSGRHIHVDDLPKVLEAIPDASIVISHVTRRTDLKYAKRILEQSLNPRDKDRVSFLMERPPRERRRPGPSQKNDESSTDQPADDLSPNLRA